MNDSLTPPQLLKDFNAFVERGRAAQAACDAVLAEIKNQQGELFRSAKAIRALRDQAGSAEKLAFGSLKSRTAQMEDRRIAKGLCGRCGKEPVEMKAKGEGSERYGVKCLKKHAAYVAKRKANQ